jgi:hypothetical protein
MKDINRGQQGGLMGNSFAKLVLFFSSLHSVLGTKD